MNPDFYDFEIVANVESMKSRLLEILVKSPREVPGQEPGFGHSRLTRTRVPQRKINP